MYVLIQHAHNQQNMKNQNVEPPPLIYYQASCDTCKLPCL